MTEARRRRHCLVGGSDKGGGELHCDDENGKGVAPEVDKKEH